jgi:hypothetical protein
LIIKQAYYCSPSEKSLIRREAGTERHGSSCQREKARLSGSKKHSGFVYCFQPQAGRLEWAPLKKNRPLSGGKPIQLRDPCCLAALLLYLLLPFIYYDHLTKSSLPAANGDLKAGPLMILSHYPKSSDPYPHNPCPICRASSSSQDYGLFTLLQAPDSAFLVQLSSFSNLAFSIVDIHLIVSGTRAPPVSS